MKVSLQFKMALMFFAVMIVSACITLTGVFFIFNPRILENEQNRIESIINHMNKLENELEKNNEILNILCSSNACEIKEIKYNDIDKSIRDEVINNGKYCYKIKGLIPSTTGYIKINNSYYKILTETDFNNYWVIYSVILISFFVCIVLGTVLTAFISKRILRPIRELNRATSEVARGNFNVKVSESGDEEYNRLIHNFNKMTKDLAGIETLRVDFISNVSHEFKTPLASIQGFAKLLQDENLSEDDRKEYTQIIIDETTRLSKLAKNILSLSKVENQAVITNKSRFLIDEQIRKIILIFEPEWSKKNIELDIALDTVPYYGSEELIGQIWQNILDNAIKFTPENGIIKVRLFRTESNIAVTISDNGIGISSDAKKKIFEKFYQGDHSRKTQGNGLGLSLVKRIVDLCEGKVSFENLYGGGVCFKVELPYIIENLR